MTSLLPARAQEKRRPVRTKPRERLLLAAAVAAPLAFVFLPQRLSLVAGLAVTFGLIAWLLRGRTLAPRASCCSRSL
jgi:hypothetical protein